MDFTNEPTPACLLVDNGSLAPAATLSLRRIATELGVRLGRKVEPVSLLHSSAVPAEKLDGRRADVLESAVRTRHAWGVREFLILPLFFGPSGALTEYIPQRAATWATELPGLKVRLAAPLVDPRDVGDFRVARIVADRVRTTMRERSLASPIVVLVDHGSPQRAVNDVREHVARQLRAELAADARTVVVASMERRSGPEFDFNEPLLERALAEPPCGGGAGDVVVAPLFFSPGRHAGPGGDIETIARAAEQAHRGLRVHLAGLVGEHPRLIDVLADRFREAVSGNRTN